MFRWRDHVVGLVASPPEAPPTTKGTGQRRMLNAVGQRYIEGEARPQPRRRPGLDDVELVSITGDTVELPEEVRVAGVRRVHPPIA